MDIGNYISKDNLLRLKVVPHASKTELVEDNNQLRLYLKAIPEKDKANLELIRFFKKEFGLRVEIESGRKGREKVVRIIR